MKERHLGIDLLKIVSMLMVLMLHVLSHGGVVDNITPESVMFIPTWTLNFIATPAVNLFILTTGYLVVNKSINTKRILSLFVQVVILLSICLLIASYVFNYQPSKSDLLNILLPWRTGLWYYTVYVAAFFLMPYINKMLLILDKKSFQKLLIINFVLFSILPWVSGRDMFNIGKGYTLLWFVVIYIAGAYIKRFSMKVNSILFFLGTLLLILVGINIKMWELKTGNIGMLDGFLREYNSPLIVMLSLCMFLFFVNLNLNHKSKFIKLAAVNSFAAYVIQDNYLMRELVIKGKFSYLSEFDFLQFFGEICLIVGSIFLIGIVIEQLRVLVLNFFGKLVYISYKK